jgi:plastocyanin
VRIWAKVSAAAAVSLVLAGAAASSGEAKLAPKTYVVTMQIVGFDPQELTVRPGDRVTWINKDLFPHTATADDKAFDSQSIATTAKWTWVAGKPGTHSYACIFHPNMKATIKVQ